MSWVALVLGAGLFATLVLSQILPGTKKGEWMGFVLLAYVVILVLMLVLPPIR